MGGGDLNAEDRGDADAEDCGDGEGEDCWNGAGQDHGDSDGSALTLDVIRRVLDRRFPFFDCGGGMLFSLVFW